MNPSKLRDTLYRIVFGTDTPAGKLFDLVLIYLILLSVAAVMMDSVESVNRRFGPLLLALEWGFTIAFSIEYLLRIYIYPKPLRYIFSFYGLVDLISIIPTYLSIFFHGASYLLIIRLIRVLRIFRVLKLVRYSQESEMLIRAMHASRRKILVFFWVVLVLSTVFGSLMFLVEGPERGFTSIPKSIYWTIVTITTVGYGDITPQTVVGQVIATLAMLTGYSIIAIPTGIVSAELIEEVRRGKDREWSRQCPACDKVGHSPEALFCQYCGEAFKPKIITES